MNQLLKASLIGSACVLGTLLSAHVANAQEELGLQLRPAIIEERADPGSTFDFTIRATNVSGGDQTFYLGAEDIKGVDDQGQPIFAEQGETTIYDISAWITLPQESVTIKAGETVTIPFKVRVPQEASPGSHFGSVFLDVRPQQVGTTGAGVGVRVGSVVSLRISGDITEDMRLREFSTAQFIYDILPATFETKVENIGNVLLRPHGLIEVTDMFGKKVASLEVNPSAGAVFPGSERTYETQWSQEGFAIGRYQALMSIVYGEDSRKTLSAATSFWVLPLKPILTALGSLLGFIILLYLVMRLYVRRKLREMGVDSTKKGTSDYYTRKYQRSASRLMFIVVAVFVFCIVFLGALFLMFA